MRILVIGLGSMGRRRIRNLQALGITEIGGFDLREDRREATAKDYKIEIFSSLSDAVNFKAKAWVISTPPLTHFDYTLQALDLGIHVFNEADLPDPRVDEVIRKRDKTNLVVAPSSTMLHYSGPKKIKELIDDKAIGRPLIFTYQSGQYLPDWHPWENYLDFYVSNPETSAAREIVPFELVWLTALFGGVSNVTGLHGRTGNLDNEIDDYYALALQFEGGIAGTLLVDVVAQPDVRSMRINGSNGTLEWVQSENLVRVQSIGESEWVNHSLDEGTRETNYINPEEPYIAEMSNFLDTIRNGSRISFSLEDDVALHEVLLQMEQASKNCMA